MGAYLRLYFPARNDQLRWVFFQPRYSLGLNFLVGFANETFKQGRTALAREVSKEGQTLYEKNECQQ